MELDETSVGRTVEVDMRVQLGAENGSRQTQAKVSRAFCTQMPLPEHSLNEEHRNFDTRVISLNRMFQLILFPVIIQKQRECSRS